MKPTHDQRGDTARALRMVTDELRAEPVPELAWDDVERRLLERIARRQPPRWVTPARPASTGARPPSGASVLPRLLGFVAAAAAVTLLLTSSARGPASSSLPLPERMVDAAALPQAPGSTDRDLGALATGDVIESGDAPVTFFQAGSVRWTLAAGSRARIATAGVGGVGHVVTLDRGTIRAEVVPRAASEGLVEAFAVEAGGTRIAVHGTLFTVTRQGDSVLVDVEHGAVAAGPTGHAGVTTGRLLVGPARASFSLDGARTARFLPREDTVAIAAAQRSSTGAGSAGGASAVDPASGPGLAPLDAAPAAAAAFGHPARPAVGSASPGPVAASSSADGVARAAVVATATEAQVGSRVNRCIADRQHARTDGVVVSVSSTLEVTLRDDGGVQSLRFDPPVRADLQDCAQSIWGSRFGGGQRTLRIPVSFASR
ncbi:MAG: FecR domain-containing protein [Polyangiaceae bacterium]